MGVNGLPENCEQNKDRVATMFSEDLNLSSKDAAPDIEIRLTIIWIFPR